MSVTVISPYLDSPDALWLRGNLHTHTTRSDGRDSPQKTIDIYADMGYDFLALSDHNVPGDYAGLDARGMLLVPGCEVTGRDGHVLAVGTAEAIERDLPQQEAVDAVVAAGGLAVLGHPDWQQSFNHYTYQQLAALTGYAGIEIFNSSVVEEPGSAYAVNKWDRLLSAGRIVWGLATDDAHRPLHRGRGWCVVRSAGRSVEAVLEALRTGSFYASTGATIESISVEGSVIRVLAPGAEAIAAVGEHGARLAWVEAPEMTFDANLCPSSFFRIECFGRADRMAWTQPFQLSGEEINRRRALVAERPVLGAGQSDRAPELKGDLSDPAWRSAGSTDRFLERKSGGRPPVKTEMLCLLAEDRLFLGFRCGEPLLGGLKLAANDNNPGSLWTDDAVEIFLDVEGRSERYFHLMVNADGRVFATEQGQLTAAPRKPQVEARAGRSDDSWTLEISVPLSDLGGRPEPGGRWGFNVSRNRTPEPGSFLWSLTGGGNHMPECFGWLEFGA